MSLQNDSEQDIYHFEGIQTYVYDDATGKRIVSGYTVQGHPTIGVGFSLDTAGLQDNEIDFIFKNRQTYLINWCEAYLQSIWTLLCEPRQRVILNMLYECGTGGFKEFINFIAALKAGDFDTAANEILYSKAAAQSPARWQWNANTMRSGEAQPYG